MSVEAKWQVVTPLRALGRLVAPLALSFVAVAGGCGEQRSATPDVDEGNVPLETALVFLATALPCKDVSDAARFTPLVVRGPGYATTIMPTDGCRRQQGAWRSYVYLVPMPHSGEVRLTPGNQLTATLSASKVQANHAATISYVNCPDYYAHCGDGGQKGKFDGRVSSIEYFKDEDVK